MRLLRNARKSSNGGANRAPLRKQLKSARKGNLYAYRLLVEAYFDLVTEYLYLCNRDRDGALRHAETVFRETWKRLPYLKRLSDWEHLLGLTLTSIANAPEPEPAVQDPTLARISRLHPERKFALIAFDLENWSCHWLALALRKPPHEVGKVLFLTRCELLDIDPGEKKRSSAELLRQISEDIDGRIPANKRPALQRRLTRNPEAREFKCRWLEIRCHMIEMRQEIRFTTGERRTFLASLEHLANEEMMRPPLRSRLRNVLFFAGAPAPQPALLPGTDIPASRRVENVG